MNYYSRAKSALAAIGSKRKKSKVKSNYDYSKYWMGDYSSQYERFSGLSQGMSMTGDLVKLIKLSNYRRAIANFVKILTGKPIPVAFSGSDSYTDGQSVNITTSINDKNFDVTVGLALHEASHILLSDMNLLKKLFQRDSDKPGDVYSLLESYIPQHKLEMFRINMYNDSMPLSLTCIKNLWNWIEDRRIDHYVFTTSPGYKAYYHKLYDYYWHDKVITKGLLSSNMREQDLDSYMFRIINMINPANDLKALPGLEEIYNIVDLKNIARLKSSVEALQVAIAVACILDDYIAPVQCAGDKTQPNPTEAESDEDGGECINTQPLNATEKRELEKAIEKQKKMLKGDFKKVEGTKRLQQKLEKFSSDAYDIVSVGPNTKKECVIVDLTKQQNTLAELEVLIAECNDLRNKCRELPGRDPMYAVCKQKYDTLHENLVQSGYLGLDYTGTGNAYSIGVAKSYIAAITKGLEVGALLGKKIQIRSEVRERVDNRLKTGHIDNKRLAHAGYGIESIFKQLSIDKYRKINLHLSLDQSGSMNGSKWEQTIVMAVAIAKSATMVNNIDVQISTRCTTSAGRRGETPVTVIVYDSRKNQLHHLLRYLRLSPPNSMTPEGLCFESMLKKKLIVPAKSDMDSYFINLSDGEPQCGDYCGRKAVEHTAAIAKKIQALGVTLIGYFMTEKSNIADNASYNDFTHMYGSKNSRHINAYSAIEIAKTLNERFMEAKETV